MTKVAAQNGTIATSLGLQTIPDFPGNETAAILPVFDQVSDQGRTDMQVLNIGRYEPSFQFTFAQPLIGEGHLQFEIKIRSISQGADQMRASDSQSVLVS